LDRDIRANVLFKPVVGNGDFHRGILSEIFSIAESNSSRSIHTNYILVVLTHLDYFAGLVPFQGIWAYLVLKSHIVSDGEWGEVIRVFRPTFCCTHVSVT